MKPLITGRVAALLAIFLVALVAVGFGDPEGAAAAARASRRWVQVGLFVTSFGSSAYMFLLSALIGGIAVVAIRRGHPAWRGRSLHLVAERAFYFFATIAASGILAQVIKHVVGRTRPRLFSSVGAFDFHVLSFKSLMTSFPSGHTTSAFAAAVALGFIVPRWRAALLAFAVLIGLSRVLVGAHYPSDVVGGVALGSLVAVLMARSFARRNLAFSLHDGRPVVIPLRVPAAAPRSPGAG